MLFTVYVAARSSTGVSAGYFLSGAVENVAGTTTLLANVSVNNYEEINGWSATAVANTTNDSLDVVVTTSGLTTGVQTRWVAQIVTSEVELAMMIQPRKSPFRLMAVVVVALLLMATTALAVRAAGSYAVPWWTIGGGGQTARRQIIHSQAPWVSRMPTASLRQAVTMQ